MITFSNRELASAVWFLAFTFWVIRQPSLKESVINLFGALFSRRLNYIYVLMISYIIAVVLALHWLGFWEGQQLKSTVYWAIGVLALTLYRSVEAAEDPHYFKRRFLDIVKITALIEFVINFYSFSFFVEFFTIPVITFVVMMQAFNEGKEEYAILKRPLELVISVYVLALLILTTIEIKNDITGFANFDTLKDLVTPPILSILFFPAMYLLLVYLMYEKAFIRAAYSIPDELQEYAKRYSVLSFRGDRILLSRWSKYLPCIDVSDKSKLRESIKIFKNAKKRENRGDLAYLRNGWSPTSSIIYLSDLGIESTSYDPKFDGAWVSHSEDFVLDDDIPLLSNKIVYSLTGTPEYVRQLKLVLDVCEPSKGAEAQAKFVPFASELCRMALDRQLPDSFITSIEAGEHCESMLRNRPVVLKRHDWAGNARGEYELIFTIEHPDHVSRNT